MNETKRALQKIAGLLYAFMGILHVINVWTGIFVYYLRSMHLTGIFVGLSLLILGLELFFNPYDSKAKKIKDKTGVNVASVVISGVWSAFLLIFSRGLWAALVLLGGFTLSMIALMLKHPHNTNGKPNKKWEEEIGAIREE